MRAAASGWKPPLKQAPFVPCAKIELINMVLRRDVNGGIAS
jgi:hypothetical protein